MGLFHIITEYNIEQGRSDYDDTEITKLCLI